MAKDRTVNPEETAPENQLETPEAQDGETPN